MLSEKEQAIELIKEFTTLLTKSNPLFAMQDETERAEFELSMKDIAKDFAKDAVNEIIELGDDLTYWKGVKYYLD